MDLVLCDLSMPVMDGAATIAALRRIRPGIPVVLMSGFGEAEGMSRIEAAGGATFLAKPFDAARLKAAMAQAVAPSR
jgi:CheY-like chemotaxis protein